MPLTLKVAVPVGTRTLERSVTVALIVKTEPFWNGTGGRRDHRGRGVVAHRQGAGSGDRGCIVRVAGIRRDKGIGSRRNQVGRRYEGRHSRRKGNRCQRVTAVGEHYFAGRHRATVDGWLDLGRQGNRLTLTERGRRDAENGRILRRAGLRVRGPGGCKGRQRQG